MKLVMWIGLALVVLVGGGAGGYYAFLHVEEPAVSDLLNNPAEYLERDLKLTGDVVDRFSLIVAKYYVLDDGTGKIKVITERPFPRVGATVTVTGHLEELYSVGDMQELVLIEGPYEASKKK